MNLEEKARALAQLYQNHVIKGYIVDFLTYDLKGPSITAASAHTNRGDHSVCEYLLDKEQTFATDDPEYKIVVAQTKDGFVHVFFGKIYVDEDEFWGFEPLFFLGEITA